MQLKDVEDRIEDLTQIVIQRFKENRMNEHGTMVIGSECQAMKEVLAQGNLLKHLEEAVYNQHYLKAQGIKNAMDWVREQQEKTIF